MAATSASAHNGATGVVLERMKGMTAMRDVITPHPKAGIGTWTIQDFARAVRQGFSPDGDPYYPVLT